MIAMPAPNHEPTATDRPFTIAEYARLAETRSGYTELIEGSLLTSREQDRVTAAFTATDPFPVKLDLDRLV